MGKYLILNHILHRDKVKGYENYLPNSIKTEGKLVLNVRLQRLQGAMEDSAFKIFYESFLRAIRIFLNNVDLASWEDAVNSYTVPFGRAIKGLHRQKKKRIKGKEKSVTIKPNRPSSRIEILHDCEKNYLEALEADKWDHYNTATKPYIKSGVPLRAIPRIRLDIASLLEEMWSVVRTGSTLLSRRRKCVAKYAKDLRVRNITSETCQEWASDVITSWKKASQEERYLVLPIEILKQNNIFLKKNSSILMSAINRFSHPKLTQLIQRDKTGGVEQTLFALLSLLDRATPSDDIEARQRTCMLVLGLVIPEIIPKSRIRTKEEIE
jgi:hypothetical protein